MKRHFLLMTIGLALTLGVTTALNLAGESTEAESVHESSSLLFAPARNFAVHSTSDERRQELFCLAQNIYWEARSESIHGQLAVAAVTLNRVKDSRFPENICDVVRQGGEIRRHRCQFSWWCDGKKDDPLNQKAWRRANTLARLFTAGVMDDPTQGALWYHADYVSPSWAAKKQRVAKIGRHIFYTYPADGNIQLSDNANPGRVPR